MAAISNPTPSDPETNAEKFDPATIIELKPSEKKALLEFKTKLEDAILGNRLFEASYDEILTGKTSLRKNKSSLEKNKSSLGKTHTPISDPCPANSNVRENIENISLWGVPLLPSKGHEGLDSILLKFLKARDFKFLDAFEMLRKTLKWRKEFKINGILGETLRTDLKIVAYMKSVDKEGQPICYNISGYFRDKALYSKTFGTEEKCEEFLRWRIQLMEEGIKKLSFKKGGVNSMVQITDLKNSPGPAMKELKIATKKALSLLQDNYPEFVSRNIFINVPFRFYASHTLFSRFLSQRTKSRCIFARPSKVAETLLKYIDPENIPVQYGGLKRENDDEFSEENERVSEKILKGGGSEIIEILVAEPGVTVVWDMTVVGWDVTYKEEFIPEDECSYRILIQGEKKMEESVRNSFYINEPGKVVLTIDNRTLKKKKILYRTKSKPTIPLYNFSR
ncbi:patellin-4-like [Tasmannia lanceolata]|uniref:patellin-4-like n=1 Tax=Tasmannia lanceolata TaxID=3420 RepID=UPI00406445C3